MCHFASLVYSRPVITQLFGTNVRLRFPVASGSPWLQPSPARLHCVGGHKELLASALSQRCFGYPATCVIGMLCFWFVGSAFPSMPQKFRWGVGSPGCLCWHCCSVGLACLLTSQGPPSSTQSVICTKKLLLI